ncbi:hypothetical protein PO909_027995 [Leuciscus waleckii]
MLADQTSGGFNLIDFSLLSNSFKIRWIKSFLKNPTSIWNCIPNFLLKPVGGLDFLIHCNYNISKLPLKLANFHKQMLSCWSLMYNHKFSPHTYFIWNNKDITYKNKTLFYRSWFDKNILLVSQLLDENCNFLSYRDFMDAFSFPIPPKEYAVIFYAIPSGVRMLLQSSPKGPSCSPPSLDSSNLYIDNCLFISSEFTNKKIRSILLKPCATVPPCISFWNNKFENIDWKRFWSLKKEFLITNKVVEVSLKIIHKCYPCNYRLSKFHNNIKEECSFCLCYPETIDHIFWECLYSRIFWLDFSNYVNKNISKDFTLTLKKVYFGVPKVQSDISNREFVINLLLFLAKFFIHKCKFIDRKPLFCIFLKDFNQYLLSLEHSSSPLAINTRLQCAMYKLLNSP